MRFLALFTQMRKKLSLTNFPLRNVKFALHCIFKNVILHKDCTPASTLFGIFSRPRKTKNQPQLGLVLLVTRTGFEPVLPP